MVTKYEYSVQEESHAPRPASPAQAHEVVTESLLSARIAELSRRFADVSLRALGAFKCLPSAHTFAFSQLSMSSTVLYFN